MKICMIMERRHQTGVSPIFAEARRFLTQRGAGVDIIFPEELAVDILNVKVEHDLYVLKSKSDLAFTLAWVLHTAGAKILNPYPVARMIRNKAVAARVLKDGGVPIPDSYVARYHKTLAPLLDKGPLIVKPYTGSRGRGIEVVRDAKALEDISKRTEMVFAQRYLKPEGKDDKIYVIGKEVFGVKRVWPAETYEEKLGEPFSVTPEVREIALQCGRVFGVELYGVDLIWNENKPYAVDMSSFPGFKGVPEAARRIADYIYTVGRRVLNGEPLLPEPVRPAVSAEHRVTPPPQ